MPPGTADLDALRGAVRTHRCRLAHAVCSDQGLVSALRAACTHNHASRSTSGARRRGTCRRSCVVKTGFAPRGVAPLRPCGGNRVVENWSRHGGPKCGRGWRASVSSVWRQEAEPSEPYGWISHHSYLSHVITSDKYRPPSLVRRTAQRYVHDWVEALLRDGHRAVARDCTPDDAVLHRSCLW
jgi:hypothetical protein